MEAEWLAMTEIDYTGRKEPGEPKGWKDYHRSEGSNCPSVHTDRTGRAADGKTTARLTSRRCLPVHTGYLPMEDFWASRTVEAAMGRKMP